MVWLISFLYHFRYSVMVVPWIPSSNSTQSIRNIVIEITWYYQGSHTVISKRWMRLAVMRRTVGLLEICFNQWLMKWRCVLVWSIKGIFFFFETLCTLFTIYRIITLNTLFTIRGCRVAAYPDNRASLMPRPTRRSILPVRKQWSWAERLWASTPLNVKLGTGTAGIDSPGDPVRTPPRAAKPASPSPPRAPCLPALCPAWHQRAWSPA